MITFKQILQEEFNFTNGKPIVFYHNTSSENAELILKNGFLLPTKYGDKGKGIYFAAKPIHEHGDAWFVWDGKGIKLFNGDSKQIMEMVKKNPSMKKQAISLYKKLYGSNDDDTKEMLKNRIENFTYVFELGEHVGEWLTKLGYNGWIFQQRYYGLELAIYDVDLLNSFLKSGKIKLIGEKEYEELWDNSMNTF